MRAGARGFKVSFKLAMAVIGADKNSVTADCKFEPTRAAVVKANFISLRGMLMA